MTKILTPTPAALDFGAVRIGQSKTLDVVLDSTGTAAVTVTAAACDAGDFAGGAADEDAYPITVALGKIWTETDSDLPPRAAFGCTKMGDYIYVVGGRRDDDSPTTYNDCRRSLDGVVWETMSAACFDKGRSDLALFNFAGKLYAVGGLVDGVATDEIWISENQGHGWVKSTTVFPQKIARMGYGQYEESAFGIYGGLDETGTYNDVFSRGVTPLSWSQESGSTPGARIDCALIYNGGWVLLCGYDGTDCLNDCWVYSGGSFSDTGSTPCGEGRAGISAGASASVILVHGGVNNWISRESSSGQATLRYSTDNGTTWTTLTATNTGRAYHAMQGTVAGKLVLIAGMGWRS